MESRKEGSLWELPKNKKIKETETPYHSREMKRRGVTASYLKKISSNLPYLLTKTKNLYSKTWKDQQKVKVINRIAQERQPMRNSTPKINNLRVVRWWSKHLDLLFKCSVIARLSVIRCRSKWIYNLSLHHQISRVSKRPLPFSIEVIIFES